MKMTNRLAAANTGQHIILIDDNKHGLAARKGVLEDAGYKVSAFSGPEEALADFGSGGYHLVVTDYRMPCMTGVELIEKMRQLRPGVPVVLLSGLVDVLGLNEKNTGADIVIAKTATEVSHLLRAAEKLLRPDVPRKPIRSQSRPRTAKSV